MFQPNGAALTAATYLLIDAANKSRIAVRVELPLFLFRAPKNLLWLTASATASPAPTWSPTEPVDILNRCFGLLLSILSSVDIFSFIVEFSHIVTFLNGHPNEPYFKVGFGSKLMRICQTRRR